MILLILPATLNFPVAVSMDALNRWASLWANFDWGDAGAAGRAELGAVLSPLAAVTRARKVEPNARSRASVSGVPAVAP